MATTDRHLLARETARRAAMLAAPLVRPADSPMHPLIPPRAADPEERAAVRARQIYDARRRRDQMLDAPRPLFHDPVGTSCSISMSRPSTRNGSRRAVPVSAPRRP